MITTCEACQARYRLDASKVPPRKIRVRCPDCGAVFDLDGSHREAAGPAAPSGPPPAAPPAPQSTGADDLVLQPTSAAAGLDPETRPVPAAEPRREPAAPRAGVAVADDADTGAEAPRGPRRRRRDKNEMLARALVSDILVYNREARDQALAEGNLLEALGAEIKKSWELYKEKVGAETATSTTHFKDALNEILAEGQQVF